MTKIANSVSILIAAHNAAGTVARAVASALAEAEVTEVIVVDDASADDTAGAARRADDGSGRLKILTQPRNAGPAAARNRGLQESRAEWIGVLDADDFFLPGRMKSLLALAAQADLIADDAAQVAENNIDGPRKSLLGLDYEQSNDDSPTRSPPLAGGVRGGVLSTNANLSTWGENPPPDLPRKGGGTPFEKPRLISFAEFVSSNVTDPRRPRGELGFIKPIMRRAFLDRHNLRYREDMRLGEDYELYARALGLGARLYIAPSQGYVSVVREHSLSGRHSELDLLRLRDCDEELGKIPGLSDADKAAMRAHYLSVDCRLQWRLLINAVKERNAPAAFATFLRPWPVPYYLTARLAEQAVWRTAKKLKGKNGQG